MIERIKQFAGQFFGKVRDELAHRKEFTMASLVVVGLLLLVAVTLSNQLLRGTRLDLTENQIFTLSKGAESLLHKIDEPINLYFFYSSDLARGIPQVSAYAQRVKDMLEEMASASGNKLKLTMIDPEPFSDAEDRAVQLGVQAVSLGGGGDKLYFGLAGTNSVGDTQAIPFFQLDQEELLEYDLAKMIYQLNQAHKPVVGLLSTLDIQGGFDMQRMQPRPGWLIVDQLRQFFDVRSLEKDVSKIPDDVQLLVLVHPAELSDATQYAIDQFVLGGGHALVFLDTYAESANPNNVQQPGQIVPRQSDPKKLLTAWGVKLVENEVLLDKKNALQVRANANSPPFYHYSLFSIPREDMDQDDVITRGLNTINVAFPGVLEPIKDATTTFTPLLKSSDETMLIPSYRIQPGMDMSTLQKDFQSSGKTYVLAARISGPAHTAFPEGAPKPPPTTKPVEPQGDAQDDEEAAKEQPKQEAPAAAPQDASKDDSKKGDKPASAQLTESKKPINVVVVADTDMLEDTLWVRLQNFFGQRIPTPLADNGNLVINSVDNLLGSDELISIRSRAGYARPFERVDALRREADSRLRATEDELQSRLQETETKLNELQSRKDDRNALILSPEQRDELLKFQQEQLRVRKELRNVQHQRDKEIDRLGTVLKFINIVLVPLLLIIGVIAFNQWQRKRIAKAKLAGGHS
ncbi:MAG: Gldg family protein [Gammaproteobacteria bacterium]|nr:Gldg family protein [Gammaproteobacteria bacterium]MCP5424014.1 Gldg family protein [Gammaproteobacteria bacterium]MCP5459553.1 Gldg family protein [Gammaproteobacteria bacterium]